MVSVPTGSNGTTNTGGGGGGGGYFGSNNTGKNGGSGIVVMSAANDKLVASGIWNMEDHFHHIKNGNWKT